MFIRFDIIRERDGHTNGQTPHDGIYRGYAYHHAVKIAIFTYPGLHFLFALGTPLWQSRKTLHKWKDNSVLAKRLAACTHLSSTVFQLFEPQLQKIAVFTYRTPHFLFPLETPLRLPHNMLHGWKDNSMLAKPLAARTMYLQQFPSYSCTCVSPKIATFTTFLFPLETPLGQSRKTLHKWKDNSVLAKPLAACTHLSSTVSQLFGPQVQKIAVFTYRSPHLFPLEMPLRLSRNILHGLNDNSILAKALAACTYLSSTVSELYDV